MKRIVVLVALALLLPLISAAVAAELSIPGTLFTDAKPVVVHETGAKSVNGTLTDCTPELLFVTPTTPKNRPDLAAKAPTTIPWTSVRSVSNGLTARLAMDMWLAKNAGNLCPTCHGERTVWCPVCHGTKHDPAAAADCPTCHGLMYLLCKTPKEKDGRIPCPNDCLKFSVGNWSKHPDGLMWRTWRVGYPGGVMTIDFSERHLGHVIVVTTNPPNVVDTGTCLICGGTTTVDDPVCFGSGQIPCPTCLARTTAGPCPNHCDNGRVVCPTCGGTGLVTKS